MIDVVAFLRFLKRHAWVMITVTALCVVLTHFLVKNLPEQYSSQAQISTGMSDRTQEILSATNMDYFRVSQQFNSLMEMMQARNLINKLSILLILHDLENPGEAFRPLSEELTNMDVNQREAIIRWYRQRLLDGKPISLLDNGQYKFYDYLASMGYDEGGLLENLSISRRSETDIINVDFISEKSELSVYVVNTLSTQFIQYYSMATNVSETNTMTLLDSILNDKKRVMDEKNAILRNYKSSSGVVNIDAQAEALYQQIAEYETKRSQAINDIQSISGAIKQINDKLRNSDDSDVNSNIAVDNNRLLRIGREIETANQRYVDNNFRPEDKQRLDSLENVRSQIVAAMSNKQINNPQANRQNLIQERTTLEIELARAQNSISSMERDLATLKGRYYTMAPAEASVQNLEREAQLSVQEYTEAMNRYNQVNTENAGRLRLRLIQEGLPGLPEPSKKMLYTAGSGVASFSICVIVFLIYFMLDNRIMNAKQLGTKTGRNVVGSLSLVNEKNKDLRHIWESEGTNLVYGVYKDLVRALRFEISQNMSANGWKVLGITSLDAGDGKTFVASSLAYAFALTGKKVLMIGDDCYDLASLISNQDKVEANEFERFLVKKEIKAEDLITVLNRNPDNTSLLELRDADNLIAGFEILRDTFDIIIIDVNSLKDVNRAKEWLMFTDCSISVFKSGSSINETDRSFLNYINHQKGFIGWVLNQVKINPNFTA